MKFQVITLGTLVTSAFLFGSSALAAPTPELSLLENVIALQGQGLSEQQVQTDVRDAMSQYLSVASPEGQSERMAAALVELGIYTRAQADAFMKAAQTGAARVAESATTPQTATDAMAAEISDLALQNPAGAQYSDCGGMDTGATIFTLGAATAVVGAILYYGDSSYDNYHLGKNLMLWGGIGAGIGAIVMIASAPECH